MFQCQIMKKNGSHKKTGNLRKTVIEYIIIIVVSIAVGILITYLGCPQCNIFKDFFKSVPLSLLFGLSIFKGINWIFKIISHKYSWVKTPFRLLFLSVLLSVFYTFIVSILIILFWNGIIRGIALDQINISEVFYFAFLIALISLLITMIFSSINFLRRWKNMAVQAELLKREKLATEYQALKNQVNPHFLFNSLNTLTSLVYKDQDMAVLFIKKLADVYRYVLEQSEKEIISLSVEIEFIRSYVYLHKIRHKDSLTLKVDVEDCAGKNVIPLSLQMLVENALKHNIISLEQPLKIEVFCEEGDYLIVKNNLQRKNVLHDNNSNKLGLKNIQSRYEFLTDKKFVVENTDKEFIVKLPLLSKVEAI